jgi:hypothetical protein
MVSLLVTENYFENSPIEKYSFKSMEELENRFKNKNMRMGALGEYTLLGILIGKDEYTTENINLFDWLYTRVGR